MNDSTMAPIRLPWPPSVNSLYKRSRNGRVYMSEKGKAFKEEVAVMLYNQGFRHGDPPLDKGPIGVDVRLCRPRNNADTDNVLKVLLDACEGWLYTDDKQIVELHVYTFDGCGEGRCTIQAYPTDRML